MSLASGSRLGSYEILAPLGAGGMGEVYKAKDTRLERTVALKVLPEEFFEDKERVARFEREAKLLAALNHPNIATLFSFEEISGRHLLVQELLEGETLRVRLMAGPLSPRKAIDVAVQVAKGLAAAHEKGIVHRDLKPENVFLTKDGRVKILDFGLSKALRAAPDDGPTKAETASALTETGTVLGTVAYMSPEQVRGEPVDHRSDIFSFGTVLYEMLTGKNPFWAASAAESMAAILKEEPSFALPEFSGAPPLMKVVARCLEKHRERRFQSAEDLAFAMETLSDPVLSLHAPTARAASFLKTRWLAVAGAVLLGLLAAGVAAWMLGRREPPRFRFTQVTFGMTLGGPARFAPDGQTVVFGAAGDSRDRNGEPVDELFTARIGHPEPRPLGIKGAYVLSISRAGEMLIGLKRPGMAPPWTLARVSLGGGAPREILEDASWATWAKDGEGIAAIHYLNGRRRNEYPLGKVLADSEWGIVGSIAFSPDGKLLAYTDGRGLVVDDLRGTQTVVRGLSRINAGYDWLPDGKRILEFVPSKGVTDAWAMTPGGTRDLLFSWPGFYSSPSFGPDGRLLVKRTLQTSHVFGRAPGEKRDRELRMMNGFEPSDLSDDGKTLLFTLTDAAGGDAGAAYLGGFDPTPAKRLGDGAGLGLSRDGRLVLCRSSQPTRLVVVPTGAGEPRTLEPEPARWAPAGFHPDSKRVWFNSAKAPLRGRCFLQPIEGGDLVPVTQEGTWCWGFSPDGKWLLVAPAGAARRLDVQPAGGGVSRPGPSLSEGEELIRWSADGRQIFTWTRTSPIRIFRIDPFSGQRQLHAELDVSATSSLSTLNVTLSGDGRAWSYGYGVVASDWYVVEGVK